VFFRVFRVRAFAVFIRNSHSHPAPVTDGCRKRPVQNTVVRVVTFRSLARRTRDHDPCMKNRTNRLIRSSVALLSCLWLGAGNPETAQRRDVPMTAEQWKTVLGKPEFKEYKGKPAVVFAQEGIIAVPGLTFTNGTVEFDVEPAGMGAGLGFRMHGLESLEFLYFRTQPNCATAPDCVQ
jgi:hypothetical protein